jgi:hypothetical protein
MLQLDSALANKISQASATLVSKSPTNQISPASTDPVSSGSNPTLVAEHTQEPYDEYKVIWEDVTSDEESDSDVKD